MYSKQYKYPLFIFYEMDSCNQETNDNKCVNINNRNMGYNVKTTHICIYKKCFKYGPFMGQLFYNHYCTCVQIYV